MDDLLTLSEKKATRYYSLWLRAEERLTEISQDLARSLERIHELEEEYSKAETERKLSVANGARDFHETRAEQAEAELQRERAKRCATCRYHCTDVPTGSDCGGAFPHWCANLCTDVPSPTFGCTEWEA